jgi:hypothetical protein
MNLSGIVPWHFLADNNNQANNINNNAGNNPVFVETIERTSGEKWDRSLDPIVP